MSQNFFYQEESVRFITFNPDYNLGKRQWARYRQAVIAVAIKVRTDLTVQMTMYQ